jgi:hypothetical protein
MREGRTPSQIMRKDATVGHSSTRNAVRQQSPYVPLVIGTVEKATWKRTIQSQLPLEVTLDALHDFKEVVSFKPTGGWGR